MIRGIVFDCFGVLAGKGFWDVYAAGGGDAVRDNAFITEMVEKASRGKVTNEQFDVIMAERLGLSKSEYRALLEREEGPNIQLLDYIRTELRPHYKLAVLSNASVGVVQQKIGAHDYELFDAVIESAATPWAKPDREIFELMSKTLGIDFSEMVFIDDLEIFIGPAGSYGIHAIRYTNLEALKTELAKILR